jgi:single-stranded DNA-binding protein
MNGVNKVILVGTLGRDPEEKLIFNFAGTSSQQ